MGLYCEWSFYRTIRICYFGVNRRPVTVLSWNTILKFIVLLTSRSVKLIYIYIYIYRERERERERGERGREREERNIIISIIEMGIYIKFCRRGKLKWEERKQRQITSHWDYGSVEWNSSFVEVQIRGKCQLSG